MTTRGRVYVDDDYAGLLQKDALGYRFTYERVYLGQPDALPVSLTLPLRAEPFDNETLFPFFDGLIPEGWLLDMACQTWELQPDDRMGLLLTCCRDCVGMVALIPEPAHA